jgi:class 3 adenylate cyclase/tetratricopeptide (TPR) repeat protein
MKCRKCQFENPAGMNFCGHCSASLELICPNCNASNPPHFTFCGACGHDLTSPAEATSPKDLSFDEKLAKIQKYLPGGLTEKILSQRDRIEGERRHITIMFVDMKGFTPLTEKLGPEETFTIMDQVFEILIHQIHDYEGTVNELRGDGVLALFGAPIALEDAPQRAIRSALAIHRDMTRFSEKIKDEKNLPPILLRIGINSGPVVVGTVGNDLRVQFTAVGDTINMAARMEQLAEPGTTYVTEDMFKLTEGFFRFQALGEKRIKGKKKLLKVYRVIAPSSKRTRFDVSAERGLSPFVGRERQLGLLIDSLERAKAGRGQAVSIMGEAGVGKSRLLYEFRKAISNEDATFLEGRCLSYSKGVPYHPIIEMLKSDLGVEDDDADADVTKKVKVRLATLGLEEASNLPYLLQLLSVKDSGVDIIRMSSQATKDRILSCLKRLILKGSEKELLVLAFEDLQLIDKSSEEAAKHLLDSIPGARVLMIFTYRPEFVHTWGGRSFHSQVTLNRLSNRESLAMAAHVLGGDVASDLQELILEKCEGVPFFIEEFLRTLSDMAIIEGPNYAYHLSKDVDHVAIPSTIQDVIMARVDSMPEAPKEALQVGSAIEREFSYELLKAVTHFPERELLSHLSVLKEAELLYERGIYPHATYVFRHSLTREVVYDSILTTRKKLLHQRIGKAIEALYQDGLDAYYSILADHFMISEDFEKSADYSKLTYERARAQGALPLAISYCQKRIAALQHLPPTPEAQRQLIDARTYLGLTLFMGGHLAGAKEAVEPIVEMTLKSNDKRRLAQIHLILGSFQYVIEEDFDPAFDHLQKAIRNAEGVGDVPSATLAHLFYGLALCWNCQFERGAESIRKALRTCEALQILWNVSAINSYLSYYAFNCRGKVEEGFGASLKALEIAEYSGDILSRAAAYVCHGISCFYKGFLAAAEDHLLKGVDLCERIQWHSFLAIGHQGLGDALFETGAYKESETHYKKAILFRQETGIFPSALNLNKVALARTMLAEGEIDLDVPSLVQLLETNKLKLNHGIIARHLAEILVQAGEAHAVDAEAFLQVAIVSHEQQGMKWDLARDYVVFAQLMRLQGRVAEEKDCWQKALSLFNHCGAEGWGRKIQEAWEER